METFSALLTFCAGSASVTGVSPSQRPVKRDLGLYLAHYDITVMTINALAQKMNNRTALLQGGGGGGGGGIYLH